MRQRDYELLERQSSRIAAICKDKDIGSKAREFRLRELYWEFIDALGIDLLGANIKVKTIHLNWWLVAANVPLECYIGAE